MKTRRGIVKDKKGFTGLEAAIVLTAFIVVAAVFSYMVLGAGFFSTEKAKAVVHTGVEKATSSAEIAGDVVGHGWQYNTTAGPEHSYYFNASAAGGHTHDVTNLTVVEFQIQLTAGQSRIDMDKVVISYSDANTYNARLPCNTAALNASKANFTMGEWSYVRASDTEIGESNMLDPNEKINVIVSLPDYGVTANQQFRLDFKPAKGGTITLTKTAPGYIRKTMVIY